MDWIEAIATYYREELQLDKHIRKTIMPKIMPATEAATATVALFNVRTTFYVLFATRIS